MRTTARRPTPRRPTLLERYDDLAGIYNIGAGNQGIARALKERGREHARSSSSATR